MDTHRPADGRSNHLWNVGELLADMAQQPTKQSSSYTLPWEREISLRKESSFIRWLFNYAVWATELLNFILSWEEGQLYVDYVGEEVDPWPVWWRVLSLEGLKQRTQHTMVFKSFTAMWIEVVFWLVAPCSILFECQRCGRTYCPQLPGCIYLIPSY
jgi:hypothetical protein